MAPRRQRSTAVEDPYIVQSKEPAFEQVLAEAILAVDPPTEIRRQLAEDLLQKVYVGCPSERLLHSVGEDRSPGLNRRVYVTEIPFVGGYLPCWVQIRLVQ